MFSYKLVFVYFVYFVIFVVGVLIQIPSDPHELLDIDHVLGS
jgi:hypothetical protein